MTWAGARGLAASGLMVSVALLAGCAAPADDMPSAPAVAAALPSSAEPSAGPSSGPAREPGAGVGAAAQVPVYLAEANLTSSLGLDLPRGSLSGVSGIRVGAPASAEFLDRLAKADPNLTSTDYAAASYDAVVISALAVASAGAASTASWPEAVEAVTSGATACGDYATCLSLLSAGESIGYQGISGASRLRDGAPELATAGRFRFDADNRLLADPEYFSVEALASRPVASRAARPSASAVAAGDVLTWLMPQVAPHALEFLNPAIEAGARLAVDDIAEAGGVPGFAGEELVTEGDLSDVDIMLVPSAGHAEVRRLIGAATAAGVLTMSPMSASRAEVPAGSRPWLWSMEAWPTLTAAALGKALAADARSRVCIVFADNAYGQQLAAAVEAAVVGHGGEVVSSRAYPTDAIDWAREVAAARKARPDAVVILGTDETAGVISELRSQEAAASPGSFVTESS